MSLDYLEDLEQSVEKGMAYYACPSASPSRWFINRSIRDLEKQAQRSANSMGYSVNIYRLVNKTEAVTGEQYLIVRKIDAPGPTGEPHFQWTLVGTREAAEMLRDVSQGPTPFFGVIVEKTFAPEESA